MRSPEQVVFCHVVEGLLTVLEGRLDASLKQRLKEHAGLDLERRLEVAYPKAQWHRMLEVASEALFPQLPLARAHWLLGERFVTAYFATQMGRALQGVMQRLGPVRTLERATRNMASGNNYLLIVVERLSPTDYRLRVNEGGVHPEFIGALCHFGTLTTGVKGLTTVVEGREGASATYRLRW
jgi:uncharacterized protein (TIGR02265 family)